MKRLILTTALVAAPVAAPIAAGAQELTVLSWGGAYGKSHEEAYVKPFEEETGTQVDLVAADNPATPIKAQVEAGNVTVDVASVEYADGVRLCDEGLLETIDAATLSPAPDGTPAEEDFLPDSLTECLVGTDVYSTIYAYDAEAFPDGPPTTIADFFDLDAYPGKRGMRKTPKANLEMALMADGVAPEEVYATLETPEGVDRAFAKLDEIKDEVVFWEAGAQPPQLLADGEVALTTAYNGRIFNAKMEEDQPFEIVWDGQVYEFEGFVIPRGTPNMEEAMSSSPSPPGPSRSPARPNGSATGRRASPPARSSAPSRTPTSRWRRTCRPPRRISRTRWPRPTSSGPTTTPS